MPLLILLGLLIGAPAWAATYWVSAGSSTSTPCARIRGSSDPGQYRGTLNSGTACLSAGDTLVIKDGTYRETPTFGVSGGGSEGRRTVYKAQNYLGATVVVNKYFDVLSNWITVDGLRFDLDATEEFRIGSNGNTNGGTQGMHVRIQNSEIFNAGGNCMSGASGVPQFLHLKRMHIHDCSQSRRCDPGFPGSTGECHGIYISSHHNRIEDSHWHHCGHQGTDQTSPSGQCLHLYSGGWSHGTVRNNLIHDTRSCAVGSYFGANNQFYNNIIYGAGTGFCVHDSGSLYANNILYANNQNGEGFSITRGGNTFRNNIVHSHTNENFGGSKAGDSTYSNNLCDRSGTGCAPVHATPSDGGRRPARRGR